MVLQQLKMVVITHQHPGNNSDVEEAVYVSEKTRAKMI